MRRSVLAIGLLIALISAAYSEVRGYGRAGVWDLDAGTIDSGVKVCGLGTGSDPQGIRVKLDSNDLRAVMQLYKDTWSIPFDTKITLSIRIDNRSPWIAKAVGRGPLVAFSFEPEAFEKFARELASGNSMSLVFTEGTENPWVIGLASARVAIGSLLDCAASLLGRPPSKVWTQPFSPG